jgi:hypothetical protein
MVSPNWLRDVERYSGPAPLGGYCGGVGLHCAGTVAWLGELLPVEKAVYLQNC